jgi:hypothetical protein
MFLWKKSKFLLVLVLCVVSFGPNEHICMYYVLRISSYKCCKLWQPLDLLLARRQSTHVIRSLGSSTPVVFFFYNASSKPIWRSLGIKYNIHFFIRWWSPRRCDLSFLSHVKLRFQAGLAVGSQRQRGVALPILSHVSNNSPGNLDPTRSANNETRLPLCLLDLTMCECNQRISHGMNLYRKHFHINFRITGTNFLRCGVILSYRKVRVAFLKINIPQ